MSAKKKAANAQTATAPATGTGSADVLGFFTESVVWAIAKQCSLRLNPGSVIDDRPAGSGLLATVEFSGPSAAGSVSLRFPENVYLFVMWRTMRERFERVTPELADGINEMTNMVFGKARALLEGRGVHVVRTGPATARPITKKAPYYACVPFSCEAGTFYLELSLTVVPE